MNGFNSRGKACISFAVGCPRVRLDAELLADYFKKNNWELTTKFQKADLVLLSTCAVDFIREKRSVKYIKIVKRKMKQNSKLILFGCLPLINKKSLEKVFNGPTIGPSTLNKIDEIINATISFKNLKDINVLDDYVCQSLNLFDKFFANFELNIDRIKKCFSYVHLIKQPVRLYTVYEDIFNIRIARGCAQKCSYCAIRFATGSLSSKPIDNIIEEFKGGLQKGHDIFRLIAEDVGSYGQDLNTNIVELLRKLLSFIGKYKIIIDDFNPKWLIQYFTNLEELFIAYNTRIAYISFPLESGSEKMLKLMRREYTAKDAEKCILKLREQIPNLKLQSHVLIGFPGEKEEDFTDTIKMMKKLKFDYILIYKYDDRPNIAASFLKNKITENTKKRRIKQFHNQFKDVSIID